MHSVRIVYISTYKDLVEGWALVLQLHLAFSSYLLLPCHFVLHTLLYFHPLIHQLLICLSISSSHTSHHQMSNILYLSISSVLSYSMPCHLPPSAPMQFCCSSSWIPQPLPPIQTAIPALNWERSLLIYRDISTSVRRSSRPLHQLDVSTYGRVWHRMSCSGHHSQSL